MKKELIRLESLLDSTELSGLCEGWDYDEQEYLVSQPDGQAILLKMLASSNQSAFGLAFYVLSEVGTIDQNFMDRAVEVIRRSRSEGCLVFITMIFYRQNWDRRYADLLISCLSIDSSMARARALVVMAKGKPEILADCIDFLASFTKFDFLQNGIEEAFDYVQSFKPQGDDIIRYKIAGSEKYDTDEDFSDDPDHHLYFLDIERVVRGLYIAHLCRSPEKPNLRNLGLSEDSSTWDQLDWYLRK